MAEEVTPALFFFVSSPWMFLPTASSFDHEVSTLYDSVLSDLAAFLAPSGWRNLCITTITAQMCPIHGADLHLIAASEAIKKFGLGQRRNKSNLHRSLLVPDLVGHQIIYG